MKNTLVSLAVLAILATPGAVFGAPKTMPNPDFTRGDAIPENMKFADWNLGATGLRGWMYSVGESSSDARQIAITKVEKGSPADGVVAVGDVILGVGGKPFSYDPRTEMGKALTLAESDAGQGKLSLTRWRAGSAAEVVVKLPVLGTYSATAPYNCPKSKRILEQGCKDLAKRMVDPSYARQQNPIPRSLNALALLASGDPSYLPLIKKETQWAANFTTTEMATWYYGYIMMFLSEYKIATGDDSVMPGLTRLALEAARGQSAVGSWGHKFARPDGRLYGYGMMNAPGVPLTISLAMARKAGVKNVALDLAIERSAKLLRFYIGKGAIPYGDHGAWMATHEDNGKCGMAAVLFNLLGEAKGAEFFSRMSVASHGSERDCGHTGNLWNILWAMPGVALSGPQATGAWMNEFGAWYFDFARGADGVFLHQRPPGGNVRNGGRDPSWDASGGYLLAYAMPLKKILLTGKQPKVAPQLDAAAAEALILDGRGWSNSDPYSAYDKLSVDQLLEQLGSWSPIVRDRAAAALGRRKGEQPVAALVTMLSAPRLETRYGACDALAQLHAAAAPAVPELTNLLSHSDLWLRVKAAETLADMGAPAMSTVPILLERLAQQPTAEDPRGMEQRFLCVAVFGKMLKQSLAGVDRDLLRKAVVAGLQNQDGYARGQIRSIYQQLSYEEIKPLLPAILQAVIESAPSGEMFADGIRLEGLRILAKYHVEEGISACVKYTREQNPWDSQDRTPQIMKLLLTYGTHAKVAIPELTKIAHFFEKEEKDFPPALMAMKAKCVRETIAAIEASTDTPELVRITFAASLVAAEKSPSEKWEKAIQAFEAADRKNPPPEGAVLFTGASNIVGWHTLTKDFPEHKLIVRGFGGAQIADVVYYADRIVIPYKPKMIVLDSGGNDLEAGKSPETVFGDFKALVEKVHAKLPDVRIAYISRGPSSKPGKTEKMLKFNQLVKDYVANNKNLDYIEAFDSLAGPDGLPRPELYVSDKVHFSPAGYKIRADLVRPYLEKFKSSVP